MSHGRALRVALTCPYSVSLYGGVQLQALGLARALRALGVDARVLAPTDGPPPLGVTSVGPSTRFPSNGSIAPINSTKAAVQRTLEALRVFEPDVLHLHEPFQPGINHTAVLATDIPIVGTFHAAHPGRNGWYDALRLPLRKMFDRLTIRTAVSPEAQRNIEATFGGPCEILPNGVDIPAFATAEPVASDVPAICFVGRHERRKGLGVLLDAYARLDRPAVLWVAGEGPETAALRARRVPRVSWLGNVSEAEKASRLRGATLACFPSVEGESFGIVLLEAMAAGAPLVASDLTGYRHVARGGREAVLVPPGDATALAARLAALLDDPARRDALRRAGQARAEEFSLARLAERLVERYELAAGRARAPVSA